MLAHRMVMHTNGDNRAIDAQMKSSGVCASLTLLLSFTAGETFCVKRLTCHRNISSLTVCAFAF